MPTDYRHKFWAERLHPATSNWRCHTLATSAALNSPPQTYRSYLLSPTEI
jgi:hypothetical protein